MKTLLRRALAMIALIAFVVTMLPLSAFAEARTSFIRSRIDSRPARPDSGIEIVPHKTENPKRSAIWDGSIATGFAGGSGTEEDPYLISDGSELAYLAQEVRGSNNFRGVYFKLTNDIYLNDTSGWESWGDGASPTNTWTAIGLRPTGFYGCFDGNGYAVRGIYINAREKDYQGLFGHIGESSIIANLGVAESYICVVGYVNHTMIGGVVGWNDGGSVTNCCNTGSVTGNGCHVGGVVGGNEGPVTDCYNTGSVNGAMQVGGVVGHNGYNRKGSATNCYNIGSVSGNSYVGGVVGKDENPYNAITYCYYYVGCCANSTSYGTALANEQMLHAESFAGFDFDTVWTMDGNPGYPYPKLINNFQTADGFEQLPEIDINEKCVYVVETGTLFPIKNAKVTVRTAEGYEIEVTSNFLGMAEISVPDSSSYTIAISCEGYCPKSLENVILKNGEFYEAALSKIDYSAPLGGSVEVTYTDANTTAPLDILAATKRLNSEEANFEFTITAKSFSDLTDGQYELLQDGDVIKTSTDGVFKFKVSDLKPDIPLWIRIRDDGKYCKPAKLGLSTYTGVFGLHDGDEVKLMDKLELPIPSDIPFLGGSVISLDLGYIPVKVKSKGDTVRIGLGTDNLFDPEDKDMWEKLKESVRKGAAAYGATGTVDLGGEVKPDLKITGFAEGKITAHGLEVVSGEMIIQAEIKYEHEWQTFA